MSITSAETNHTNFNELADKLLNKTVLFVNDKKYRIVEIEFYYKNNEHNDEYTHCDPDQKTFGAFYFHKFRNGSYKSGTFKGMDMTFGDSNDTTNIKYFGILIRSVIDLSNNSIIEGPCNCVNAFLNNFGFKNVNEYMNAKIPNLKIYNKDDKFYISHDQTEIKGLNKETIYKGPRVGLSDKYPDFLVKNYRYCILKNRIKKQKVFPEEF